EQMRVVEQVLGELGTNDKEILTVYNKIDQCPLQDAELIPQLGDSIRISALAESDVERLKLAIEERAVGNRISYRIPIERGDLIASVYQVGEVLDREVDESHMMLHVRADKKHGQAVN